MVDVARTKQLLAALVKYHTDGDEKSLLQEIDRAVKEGYIISLNYGSGGYQMFGPGYAIVTFQSKVGDALSIVASKPDPPKEQPSLDALSQEERKEVDRLLRIQQDGLMRAIGITAGVALFAGLEDRQAEITAKLNEAFSMVKSFIRDVGYEEPMVMLHAKVQASPDTELG